MTSGIERSFAGRDLAREIWLTVMRFHFKYKICENDGSVQGVVSFLADNNLNTKDTKDVAFAALVSKLVAEGIVSPHGEHPTPAPTAASDYSLVTVELIDRCHTAYSSILLVASVLAYVAPNPTPDDDDSHLGVWYDALEKSKGPHLISRSKFVHLVGMICLSGEMGSVMSRVSAGEVRAMAGVVDPVKGRIAALVKKAVELLPEAVIRDPEDAAKVKAYKDYGDGGVFAEIATGPLKHHCVGELSPFEPGGISDDAKLVSLKGFERPLHEIILARVWFTLEICGCPPVRGWHQGERARNRWPFEKFLVEDAYLMVKRNDPERFARIKPLARRNLDH